MDETLQRFLRIAKQTLKTKDLALAFIRDLKKDELLDVIGSLSLNSESGCWSLDSRTVWVWRFRALDTAATLFSTAQMHIQPTQYLKTLELDEAGTVVITGTTSLAAARLLEGRPSSNSGSLFWSPMSLCFDLLEAVENTTFVDGLKIITVTLKSESPLLQA